MVYIMTAFYKFSFLVFFLVACLTIAGCKALLNDNQDIHINWISLEKDDDLLLEGKKKDEGNHMRFLQLNAQNLSKQNNDILNHLQEQHERSDTIQHQNHKQNITKNVGNKKVNSKTENSVFKRKRRQHTINNNSLSDHDLIENINVDESFMELAKSKSTKEKNGEANASNGLNENCDSNSTDCFGTADISKFVNLMNQFTGSENEEEEDDKTKDFPPPNEDVDDDDYRSMYIYNGDKSKPDLYEKYKTDGEGNMQIKQIESIEYIGAGYDVLFGNPTGDPILRVDPGYRDSIIKLTYPKSDEDFPESFESKSPNGSYVRNEISCSRFEKEQEINTMSQYSHELSSDTSINISFFGFSLFSASSGYKETSETFQRNKEKLFMLKNYCFQYVASLSNYGQWELTDQFNRAITMLPSHFNSLEYDEDTCTATEMKKNMNEKKCGPSVRMWMQFFKSFGTHVSTLLHLGGKITQTIKKSKSESKSSSSESSYGSVGASGSVGGNTQTNTSSTKTNESSSSSSSSETIIIGGRTIYDPNEPADFEKWAQSVKHFPMPIKGEYEPISKILPKRLATVYDEAIEFYISLYGSTSRGRRTVSIDMEKIDLRKTLRETLSFVSNDGPGMVSTTCPGNSTVILGFKFSFPNDFKLLENFEISPCELDEKTCASDTNDLDVYNNIFAICADDPLPFMEQETITEIDTTATLRCSHPKQIILWGFAFIFSLDEKLQKNISVKACKYGKNHCTFEAPDVLENGGVVRIAGWVVCIHQDYVNSAHTTKVKGTALAPYNKQFDLLNNMHEDCPNDVLFTVAISISRAQFEQRQLSCFQTSQRCPNGILWCGTNSTEDMAGYFIVVY